jgi:hypothetical protein
MGGIGSGSLVAVGVAVSVSVGARLSLVDSVI